MCEHLLCVKDKNERHRGPRDFGPPRRGDIVVVVPDGWTWARKEVGNPEWRIVQLPGVNEMDFANWVEPFLYNGEILQKRAYYINLDSPDAKWLTDSLSTNQAVSLSKDEIEKYKKLKAARNSPIAEMV